MNTLFNTKGQKVKGSKNLKSRVIFFPLSAFDPLTLCPFVLNRLNQGTLR